MPVKFKDVRNIGIDEFAIKKGHIYQTIVVDQETTSGFRENY